MRRGRKKQNNDIKHIILLVILVLVFSALGYNLDYKIDESKIWETEEVNTNEDTNIYTGNINNGVVDPNLKIHYVDVGQGDCTILEQNGHYMIIDAGTNACEDDLLAYIDSLNITKFDYVVATHGHEDHIGSMDAVIKNYDVGKILFPKHTTTTYTYRNFVKAVANKKIKLYAPKVGEEFVFEDSKFVVLAPNSSEYEELNNYSIVIKLMYKETNFLFTADAEKLSEQEMLENDLDLSADVLRVAHHGSSSSTTQEFLEAVNPKCAVISVGKDNDYGHPTINVINRLKDRNIPVYRTDENGTVVLTSNGRDITFNGDIGSYGIGS